MGSGKTEAALFRFARLLADREIDGLYFALPTRVAATSLYKRVCRPWHASMSADRAQLSHSASSPDNRQSRQEGARRIKQ